MSTPSCAGRSAASIPARDAAVGNRSQNVKSVPLFRELGAMCPGQEAKIVCRIPPSCKLRFFPRKGPGSSKSDLARNTHQATHVSTPRAYDRSKKDGKPKHTDAYKVVIVRAVVPREKHDRII